ncbi:alpha/beta hydrolase family esterase [Sulfitobacter aestuariivivens]|uniref:Polyhydroxybutyrate depolymerase n=1 Tax=Sulfitobacter aestuariivivens TaxID=2766981 RepID=A0A927D7P8_9RHOB|nr:PHB depolymerase family esterase [Sulfitobacter aestuariivivens]MBD3664752.1 polyhydroxybutyrate depolymerase [Sulfitobacter aestuariivivens]
MISRILLALMFFTVLPHTGQAQDCGLEVACRLGDRSYHVRLPDDWDGTTPMPVLLHFHGWQRQGGLIVKHQRISGHTRRRGVLLIAPNGQGRTWDFWDAGTDDVPFAAAVIEDVAKRYPIDRARLYVSGYSYGSAMAWRYVCQNGNDVTALLAISGTIRAEDCPQAPREVRQVYGFNDTVMRLPFGPDQNETRPVDMWLDLLDCGNAQRKGAWQAVDWLTLDRRVWDDCANGRKVTLDLHPGGHFIPHGWIGWQLDQLMGRVPTYP